MDIINRRDGDIFTNKTIFLLFLLFTKMSLFFFLLIIFNIFIVSHLTLHFSFCLITFFEFHMIKNINRAFVCKYVNIYYMPL